MKRAEFRPCAVIPVFNHGETVGGVVAALRKEGLPVFLVDDGSDAATKASLAAIGRRTTACKIITLPSNRGKGAAVSQGLVAASEDGYTHALQVDADGQHDLADVPRFLRSAEEQPDALVNGAPVFDDSIPPSRRVGRKITSFWVAVETLSRDIPEAMCGFRVYPLAPACRLISRTAMASRMAFDIEILVRLHWRGVRMLFLPTRVIYPKGGVSHFRMTTDNLIISMVHAKLFAGMLVRLPLLLARRVSRARVRATA